MVAKGGVGVDCRFPHRRGKTPNAIAVLSPSAPGSASRPYPVSGCRTHLANEAAYWSDKWIVEPNVGFEEEVASIIDRAARWRTGEGEGYKMLPELFNRESDR